MTMEAFQRNMLLLKREFNNFISLTRLNRCSELRVNLSCCNSLICMRVYSRSQSQKNLLLDASAGSFSFNCFDFFNIVSHKISDSVFYGVGDVSIGFVVAVEICVRKVVSGLKSYVYFS